jgi:hypothetical protein
MRIEKGWNDVALKNSKIHRRDAEESDNLITKTHRTEGHHIKPVVIPAKAGIHNIHSPSSLENWIPAFAGMTCIFFIIKSFLCILRVSAVNKVLV